MSRWSLWIQWASRVHAMKIRLTPAVSTRNVSSLKIICSTCKIAIWSATQCWLSAESILLTDPLQEVEASLGILKPDGMSHAAHFLIGAYVQACLSSLKTLSASWALLQSLLVSQQLPEICTLSILMCVTLYSLVDSGFTTLQGQLGLHFFLHTV